MLWVDLIARFGRNEISKRQDPKLASLGLRVAGGIAKDYMQGAVKYPGV